MSSTEQILRTYYNTGDAISDDDLDQVIRDLQRLFDAAVLFGDFCTPITFWAANDLARFRGMQRARQDLYRNKQ